MLNEQTEMKAAIILWEKALEIRENLVTAKVLDQDHPNRANSFTNLGVGVAHHDSVKAVQLHRKAHPKATHTITRGKGGGRKKGRRQHGEKKK